MGHAMAVAITRALGFVKRQKRNYRVTVTRAALSSFLAGLTFQYDSIYTVGLGADKVRLGGIGSIGAAIGSLIAAPVGWLVDRYGLKRFYVLGIGLMAGAMLVYAMAPDWRAIILAMILLSISMRLTGTGCGVLCADSLKNKDRSTGQNLCNTISRSLALLSPLIGARLITAFGGMNVEGIRPLYYIQFVGYGLIFLFVAAQLSEPERMKSAEEAADSSVIHDFRRLFKQRTALKRWIAVASLSRVPMVMIPLFLPVFAHEVKGADAYTLAGMTMAGTVTYLLFGIPMGRLADRIGRKKVIYLATPLWYASTLLLVLSPNAATLILAGAFWSFYSITSIVTSSMTMELVPVGQMGRWSGLLGLFAGLVTVPAPLIGGLIWKGLGPAYVFLIPVALDLLVKIPLLTTIPETLHTEHPPPKEG
jgi:MFS family permease